MWDLKATNPSAAPILLEGHHVGVLTVAISPNNHWLVTASGDATARLWDLTAANPGTTSIVLRGHDGWVEGVAFSSDSHWLVTTGRFDRTARIWDLTAENPAAESVPLQGHQERVTCVAISNDNHWIATGGWDKTARVWPLQIKDLIDLARITAGRNLSRAEWDQYFAGKKYRKTFAELPGQNDAQ